MVHIRICDQALEAMAAILESESFFSRVKRSYKGILSVLFVIMVSLMVAQFCSDKQKRVIMVEKICPKNVNECFLIKDESLGTEKNDVLRSLVPEKYPEFALAQVLLEGITGSASSIKVYKNYFEFC
ncbi:unnamed protein product [Thelazia callipaeda]|uniref:VKc domain-containing protein n=1 Tax=Thelazia callipaeda TaxID=103827 RepID=A0A0N5CRE5_THECL|nr:unnamed protein product [Thelazia callipaeda]